MKKCVLISERAVSLPELCVSICLLATVIVIIMGIICGGITGIRKGEESLVIGNLLKTELEYYSEEVLYDFDNIAYFNAHCVKNEKTVDGVKLKEEWISFSETGSGRNKLKEVTVSIYWYDRGLSGYGGIKKRSSTCWINNYLD
jgi:hypothetical protein